jgi:hypothetical protein
MINNNSSGVSISEDMFYSWLLKEPQTLVWLPTFHRVAASESSNLYIRCNIHVLNKGNNKITELRTILLRESQNSLT